MMNEIHNIQTMKLQLKYHIFTAMLLCGVVTVHGQVIRMGNDGRDAVTAYGAKPLEFVDGAQGKSFRTDGYSTYATTEIVTTRIDASTFSMSLWCAPETYPMMNVNEAETVPTYATIIGNIDDVDKTGFAFELSSQGDYRFRCYAGGWETVCPAAGKLPCRVCSHLVAVRNGRLLYLYNNGTQL